MAQFYTVEEAARVLGMSPEELGGKAQRGEIHAFLDSGTWRFRVVDIDELARRQGLGSDAELRLSDLDAPAVGSADDLEELDLSEFQLGVAKPDLGAETAYFPTTGGSDHDIVIDDLSVPPSPVTGSSSVIIGMRSGGKQPSDSDVRLVPEDRGVSDSDVRLASAADSGRRQLSDSDVTLIKDDTIEHGLMDSGSGSESGPESGSSASETVFRPSPVLSSSAEVSSSGATDDSDFELSPASDLVDALEPESGSDFELGAIDDASDEFEATPLKPGDSDVTAADPNLSGINLSRPSDSGINLLGPGFGGESIELAPLSDDDLPSGRAAASASKPSAKPAPAAGSDEKDIFEDTDFEVDASFDDDSDDRTVQIQAGSDFDMDSGSEVFAVGEDDVDQNAATAMAPSAFAEDDDEEDDGFEGVVADEVASAWAVDDSSASVSPSQGMVISREAAADWDGLSVGLLAVTSVFIFLASFLAYDLVQNLYEFNEGGPASGIVHSISGMFFQ